MLNRHAYPIYNQRHQVRRQERTGGQTVDYSYDDQGQLTGATGREPGGAVRLQELLAYGYDAAGNLTNRLRNAFQQRFSIDDFNQITAIEREGPFTVSGALSAEAESVTVLHNADPGRGAVRYGDKTYALEGVEMEGAEHQFTVLAKGTTGARASTTVDLELPESVSLEYDGHGNLLGDGQRVFEYDEENQLTAVEMAGQWRTEFVYDGLGRLRVRIEKAWNGSSFVPIGETRYIYDGRRVIQERNGSNQPLVTYTRGLDLSGSLEGAGGIGGLLARTDANGTAYYHCDGNGNVTALMNSATTEAQQVLLAKYLYDPFGNILGQWGPLADANVYRFSSKEYHANSGLYYYGFRFYDPNLQRWLNRDPIGELGGYNLYGFVGNNPLYWVDPYGLDWTDYVPNGIYPAANFCAGAADILSFNTTALARQGYGIDDVVDKSSGGYKAGEWGGTGLGFAMGGAGAAKGAAKAGAQSLRKKLYEIGQKTLTNPDYKYFAGRNADPVRRGIDIVRHQGWPRASLPSPLGLLTQGWKTPLKGLTPLAAQEAGTACATGYGVAVGAYGVNNAGVAE